MISDDFSAEFSEICTVKDANKLLQTCTCALLERRKPESYIDVVPANHSYIDVGHQAGFEPLRLYSTPCSDVISRA